MSVKFQFLKIINYTTSCLKEIQKVLFFKDYKLCYTLFKKQQIKESSHVSLIGLSHIGTSCLRNRARPLDLIQLIQIKKIIIYTTNFAQPYWNQLLAQLCGISRFSIINLGKNHHYAYHSFCLAIFKKQDYCYLAVSVLVISPTVKDTKIQHMI